ncbi:MAG: TolC family protein [Crocinitomicaceae bacterium]|nr:TolC family protein [Crocinitomicaceae bacterium]
MKLKQITTSLVFLACFASFGQTELSATDAVVIALENNYQILIAEKQQDISVTNNKWSEAGAFPTVDLSISQNNTIQDNTNNPFTFTPGIILSQGVNPAVNVNYNIFTGFAVKMSKQRLEQLEEQSANNAMTVIESTIQDVLKAYFTAQVQKERLSLFQTILDQSRKRKEYYELKDKYSATNSLELLQFENQYLTDSTNYLIQKISLDNAYRNLQLIMNDGDSTGRQEYILTDKLVAEIPPISFDQAYADMLENNANLKGQYIGLELQKTATELQKSFLYPTLSFQMGVQPGWSKLRDLSDANLNISTQTLSYYGNFNLRYTLFNNFKNKRAVEVSKIQEEIAELNIESITQTLENTLRNLVELYDARNQLVSISQQNLDYATQAYELAEKRFKTGALNSIDLMTFQSSYETTMIQHYENLFNRLDTYLEIHKLTGKLGLTYSK